MTVALSIASINPQHQLGDLHELNRRKGNTDHAIEHNKTSGDSRIWNHDGIQPDLPVSHGAVASLGPDSQGI